MIGAHAENAGAVDVWRVGRAGVRISGALAARTGVEIKIAPNMSAEKNILVKQVWAFMIWNGPSCNF
jgi:hypothetical protein